MAFKFLTDNDPSFKAVWFWAKQLVTELNKQKDTTAVAAVPTGGVMQWAAEAAPVGWLLCDGGSYDITEQSALFAVIGYRWGGGSGRFNVPDFRNRSPMGAGDTVSIAAEAGARYVTIGIDNLPSHDHGVTDPGHTHVFTGTAHTHALTDPGHTHVFVGAAHTHGVTDAGHTHVFTGTAHNHGITDPTHSHTLQGGYTANTGTAFLNTISAGTGWSQLNNTDAASTGITINNATATGTNAVNVTGVTINNATATGTNNANTTGITANNAVAGGNNAVTVTAITINKTGGGQQLETLSPVLGINFIIKA